MNTKAEIKAEQMEKKFARVSSVTRTLCKNIYKIFTYSLKIEHAV